MLASAEAKFNEAMAAFDVMPAPVFGAGFLTDEERREMAGVDRG
ncbi:MAG: hypothetical protein ABW063_03075 [Caulobacter sp.]